MSSIPTDAIRPRLKPAPTPGTVEIAGLPDELQALDDPNAITPESNVFLRERLHWVKFNEDMRNYEKFPEAVKEDR